MKPNVQYKISSMPSLTFKRKAAAMEFAAGACLLHKKPQVIMTVRGRHDTVVRYEVLHTEEMAEMSMSSNTMAIRSLPETPTSIRAIMWAVRHTQVEEIASNLATDSRTLSAH